MPTQVLTINDFSGGDLGFRRPSFANDMRYFSAVNVWRYPTGGIGPRQPVTRRTMSGDALLSKNIYRCDFAPAQNGNQGFIVLAYSDRHVQYITTNGTVATAATLMTDAATDSVALDDKVVYVSVSGPGSIFDGTDVIPQPNLPAGYRIEKFKQRYVVSGNGSSGAPVSDIQFSALNDPNSWPAANTFQVTEGDYITDLWVMRNNLIIPSRSGSLYRVSGVLGVNETLQRVDIGPPHGRYSVGSSPYLQTGGAALAGDAWYLSGERLVNTDGTQITTVPTLVPNSDIINTFYSHEQSYFVSGADNDEFIFLKGQQADGNTNTPFTEMAILQHHADGSFTRHVVPITTSSSGLYGLIGTYDPLNLRYHLFTDGSSGATEAPRMYDWDTTLKFNQPGTAGNDGDSGADVEATFYTNEWVAPEGKEVIVERVIVDYSTYEYTPDSGTFRIAVQNLHPTDSTQIRTSTPVTFTPVDEGFTPDYTSTIRGRTTFGFGDQGSGGAFRIRIDEWKNIQIHQILVFFSLQEARI